MPPHDERAAMQAAFDALNPPEGNGHGPSFARGWQARGAFEERRGSAVVLARLKDKHQERAAGVLWNGPHGACSACMLPYPCAVIRALKEAEEAS